MFSTETYSGNDVRVKYAEFVGTGRIRLPSVFRGTKAPTPSNYIFIVSGISTNGDASKSVRPFDDESIVRIMDKQQKSIKCQ